MKLVIGIVRPEKANDVLEALYRAEVRGFSMSRVQGHGGELDRVETYRGTTRADGPVGEGPLRDRRLRRLRRSRRSTRSATAAGPARSATARSSCSPLEQVVRIRTGETDNARRDAGGRLMAAARVDAGDTAWMLAATALVLLMTPALGLFYAGPRALQEHAQHVHDVRRRARASRRSRGRSSATRSRSTSGNGFIGGLDHAFLHDVAFAPRDGHDDPAPAVHGLPGDVLHRHHRAGVGRGGRADALRRRSSSSPRCGRCSSTRVLAHWAFGGGWLQAQRHARLRRRRPGRDGLGLLGAGRRARRRRAQGLRAPGAAAAQRGLRAARRRACCGSAGSASTAAAGSRPGNAERARVRQHAAHARRARSSTWFVLDLLRVAPGDGDRRGDGDHRRLRRDHARPAGFISPVWAMVLGVARRAAELRGDRAGARARASTRRSTCSPPTASPGFTGHPLHRLLRPGVAGTASPTACVYGNAAQLGQQALAVLAAPGLRVRGDLRAAAS